MNLRAVERLLSELTTDVRAVEATAVKDGEKLKSNADVDTAAFQRVNKDIAEIQNWQIHVDMDLDAKDAFDAKLQTQIDCCQVKRPWFDIILAGSFVPMWLCGIIVLADTIISWLTK